MVSFNTQFSSPILNYLLPLNVNSITYSERKIIPTFYQSRIIFLLAEQSTTFIKKPIRILSRNGTTLTFVIAAFYNERIIGHSIIPRYSLAELSRQEVSISPLSSIPRFPPAAIPPFQRQIQPTESPALTSLISVPSH